MYIHVPSILEFPGGYDKRIHVLVQEMVGGLGLILGWGGHREVGTGYLLQQSMVQSQAQLSDCHFHRKNSLMGALFQQYIIHCGLALRQLIFLHRFNISRVSLLVLSTHKLN